MGSARCPGKAMGSCEMDRRLYECKDEGSLGEVHVYKVPHGDEQPRLDMGAGVLPRKLIPKLLPFID